MNRLVLRKFGPPPEVVELEASDLPELREGEVRLKILAAPINPADLNLIEGTYGIKPELPVRAGLEGVGEVVASRDTKFAVGDRAIFLRRSETWASHVQVPAKNLHKLPEGLEPLQAAMLKVNPATAWILLHEFRPLREGDWVVQNVGNSGVGRCVIQLAKLAGLRTLSFVRRTELISELTELGADKIVLDNEEGLNEAKETLPDRAALALNAVGGDSALRLMNLLGQNGMHVTYGAMGRRPLTIPNGPFIFEDLQFRSAWLTRWLEQADRHRIASMYDELAHHVKNGELAQPVDSTFGLQQHRQAIERAMQSGRRGKVLFVP